MAVLNVATLIADGSYTFWISTRPDPRMREHSAGPDPADYTILPLVAADFHEVNAFQGFVNAEPLILYGTVSTTDATPTAVSLTGTQAFTLEEGYVYELELVAKAAQQTGGVERHFTQRQLALVWRAVAGAAAMAPGSPSTTHRAASLLPDVSWDAVLGVSGNNFTVTVTGVAGVNADWDVIVFVRERQEVTP